LTDITKDISQAIHMRKKVKLAATNKLVLNLFFERK